MRTTTRAIASKDYNGDGWISMLESFDFARLSVERLMGVASNVSGYQFEQSPKIYNGLEYDPLLILREQFLETDLNKDGIVNIHDLYIIAKAFTLLAPWITLTSLLTVTVASIVYVKRKRKQQD